MANLKLAGKTFPTVSQLDAAEGWMRHNGFLVLPEDWMVEPVRRDLAERLAPQHISMTLQNDMQNYQQLYAILLLS
jgi:hypothetical protein